MKKPFQLPEKMARYRGQFEQSARDFLKLDTRKGKQADMKANWPEILIFQSLNSILSIHRKTDETACAN